MPASARPHFHIKFAERHESSIMKKAKVTESGQKYGPKASQKVERAMHEIKEGKLRSGKSGKKVTNPKQAIAIGLSEARHAGGKIPPAKKAKRS